MKKVLPIITVLFFIGNAESSAQKIEYTDASKLTLYGKPHTSGPRYHRVDTARYGDMPARVKVLSTYSAGLVIAFKTNSKEIYAKWQVKPRTKPYKNMTVIASRGLDLYIKKNDQWIFAGAGVPDDSITSTHRIVTNMTGGMKECLLFLPLYDELLQLEIGIQEGTTIAPLKVTWKGKVVIYGSSITQGTSASRPGMAYPAQLTRKMPYEFVNLGFSATGKMEQSVGRMVADVQDVDLFILDCAANPSPEEIADRTEPFVKLIRDRHPGVPILMIESVVREGGNFDQKIQQRVSAQNTNFRNAYNHLVERGVQDLYLINGDDLLGHDHEATVDGTHPNDLGFDRMLKVIEPKVREILKLSE
jgi:lysophospholipase L1-like esterase